MTVCEARWPTEEYDDLGEPADYDRPCGEPAIARALLGAVPILVCDLHAEPCDLRLTGCLAA